MLYIILVLISMLKVITYNCHGLLSSLQDVIELSNQYDLIFLQETWLFKHELCILNNLHVVPALIATFCHYKATMNTAFTIN